MLYSLKEISNFKYPPGSNAITLLPKSLPSFPSQYLVYTYPSLTNSQQIEDSRYLYA